MSSHPTHGYHCCIIHIAKFINSIHSLITIIAGDWNLIFAHHMTYVMTRFKIIFPLTSSLLPHMLQHTPVVPQTKSSFNNRFSNCQCKKHCKKSLPWVVTWLPSQDFETFKNHVPAMVLSWNHQSSCWWDKIRWIDFLCSVGQSERNIEYSMPTIACLCWVLGNTKKLENWLVS